MTILRGSQSGSPAWEDAASEPAFRRMQQVRSTTGPRSARALPGMPVEVQDIDEDDDVPRRRRAFETPSGPWWRPASTFGRIVLGTCGVLSISAVITGYVMAKRAIDRDARFRLASTQNVQAAGMGEVTRAEILPVFGDDIGRNIFQVHLSDRRKQLEHIPWVQSATVERFLPDQIRVSVVERKPIAFVREGQQIGLVDADGVLLSMPPAGMTQHHYSFPVVTGINAADAQSARRARMAIYQRLIADLDSSGQHLSDQLSEIDLSDPEDARILMPEQGGDILAHFGEDQFLQRYQRYKAHIAEWRQQYPRLAAVDLRYDHQVVLQMTPGSTTEQLAVNAADGKPSPAESIGSASKGPIKPFATSKAPAAIKAAVAPPKKIAVHHAAQHPKPVSHTSSAQVHKKHPEPKHPAHPKPSNRAAAAHPSAAHAAIARLGQ